MNSRVRNLAITAGIVVFFGWWGLDLFLAPHPQSQQSVYSTTPEVPVTLPPSVPDASSTPVGVAPDVRSSSVLPTGNRVSYAIYVHDLQGFPPDAGVETRLELWVAWEPPITETPQMQRLLTDLWVEKIVPGMSPEAPVTAILSVRRNQLSDLLYADRWGSLAVAAH